MPHQSQRSRRRMDGPAMSCKTGRVNRRGGNALGPDTACEGVRRTRSASSDALPRHKVDLGR